MRYRGHYLLTADRAGRVRSGPGGETGRRGPCRRRRIGPAKSDCVWSVGEKPVMPSLLPAAADPGDSGAPGLRSRRMDAGGGPERRRPACGGACRPRSPERPVGLARENHIALLGHLVGDGSTSITNRCATQRPRRITAGRLGGGAGCFRLHVKRYAGRGNWHQLLITGTGTRCIPPE